jgi:hypothetical protein
VGFAAEAKEIIVSSIRLTNVFLAIIAACLLSIVGKDLLPAVLPPVHAAPTVAGATNAQLYACSDYNPKSDECKAWRPVLLGALGGVITQVGK